MEIEAKVQNSSTPDIIRGDTQLTELYYEISPKLSPTRADILRSVLRTLAKGGPVGLAKIADAMGYTRDDVASRRATVVKAIYRFIKDMNAVFDENAMMYRFEIMGAKTLGMEREFVLMGRRTRRHQSISTYEHTRAKYGFIFPNLKNATLTAWDLSCGVGKRSLTRLGKDEALYAWATTEQSPAVGFLFGEYGAGKTTVAKNLALRLRKEIDEQSSLNQMSPIYIGTELLAPHPFYNFERAVEIGLSCGLDTWKKEEIFDAHPRLFIIDHSDFIYGRASVEASLYAVFSLAHRHPRSKFLIVSRPEVWIRDQTDTEFFIDIDVAQKRAQAHTYAHAPTQISSEVASCQGLVCIFNVAPLSLSVRKGISAFGGLNGNPAEHIASLTTPREMMLVYEEGMSKRPNFGKVLFDNIQMVEGPWWDLVNSSREKVWDEFGSFLLKNKRSQSFEVSDLKRWFMACLDKNKLIMKTILATPETAWKNFITSPVFSRRPTLGSREKLMIGVKNPLIRKHLEELASVKK